MNEEKFVAKFIEKSYKGKISKEEAEKFLFTVLKQTALWNKVKDLHTVFRFQNLGPDGKITGTSSENRVLLDNSLIENISSRKSNAIIDLISNFGHETTHRTQPKYAENEYLLTKQDFIDLCSALKIQLSDEDCQNLADANYLNHSHEREARIGGAKFVEEVVEYLLENKYLNVKYKELLKQDITNYHEKFLEEVAENERFIQGTYLKFKKNEIDQRDMESIAKLRDTLENSLYNKIFEIRMGVADGKQLLKDYCSLIGMGKDYWSEKHSLIRKINDKYPAEFKEKLQNIIVGVLCSKELEPQLYDFDLLYVLTPEQISKLYEDVLIRDITKVDDCYLFEYLIIGDYKPVPYEKEQYQNGCCKAIINAIKNGKLLIKNTEDINALQSAINKFLDFAGNIDEDIKDELKKINEKINAIGNTNTLINTSAIKR